MISPGGKSLTRLTAMGDMYQELTHNIVKETNVYRSLSSYFDGTGKCGTIQHLKLREEKESVNFSISVPTSFFSSSERKGVAHLLNSWDIPAKFDTASTLTLAVDLSFFVSDGGEV